MVCAKVGDPFHLNIFPHIDVVTFGIFYFCIIKLRILWNTTIMTQHWKISRLVLLCLPNKLVHILYCCSIFSLINNSFQISSKLRYIRIKESAHSIISRFFKIEVALNNFFIGTYHWFFSLTYFSGDIMDFFLHVCTIKVLLCGQQKYFLE